MRYALRPVPWGFVEEYDYTSMKPWKADMTATVTNETTAAVILAEPWAVIATGGEYGPNPFPFTEMLSLDVSPLPAGQSTLARYSVFHMMSSTQPAVTTLVAAPVWADPTLGAACPGPLVTGAEWGQL